MDDNLLQQFAMWGADGLFPGEGQPLMDILRPRAQPVQDPAIVHAVGTPRPPTPRQPARPPPGLHQTASAQGNGLPPGPVGQGRPLSPKEEVFRWLKANMLTDEVAHFLVNNVGCDSMPAVQALKEEDLPRLGMPIAQQRLLEKALGFSGAHTQPPPAPVTQPMPAAQAGQAAAAGPLQALLMPATPNPPGHYVMHLDRKPGKADYLDITDFLPLQPQQEEETKLVTESGDGVVLKTGTKKTDLDKVTIPQWNCANMAIMDKLILDGKLSNAGERDYRNYTYIINELAIRYQWQSVLLYDREYRKLQATQGFRWGHTLDHSGKVFLKEKVYQQGKTDGQSPGGKGNKSEKQDKWRKSSVEVCRNFNEGNCFRDWCKFAHICSVPRCNKPHARTEHGKQGAGSAVAAGLQQEAKASKQGNQ